MAASSSSSATTLTLSLSLSHIFVAFLLVSLCYSASPVSSDSSANSTQTFLPRKELLKLKRVNAYLKKINKPAVKTIQSPDGDVFDCVLSHLQPAFDHPLLKGHKPLDPPERPKSNETSETEEIIAESFQQWHDSGESCPEGTVPIRRTTEKDVLRANKLRRFGKKPISPEDAAGLQSRFSISDHRPRRWQLLLFPTIGPRGCGRNPPLALLVLVSISNRLTAGLSLQLNLGRRRREEASRHNLGRCRQLNLGKLSACSNAIDKLSL
ncbi:unnamed protein product [Linum trigynum]|uniref:Neprosin activation peptide domain-containing protein n=1 Tax=Linum trigynum TaxID=586398 RepID=A0AAV2G5I3_9ROSI